MRKKNFDCKKCEKTLSKNHTSLESRLTLTGIASVIFEKLCVRLRKKPKDEYKIFKVLALISMTTTSKNRGKLLKKMFCTYVQKLKNQM